MKEKAKSAPTPKKAYPVKKTLAKKVWQRAAPCARLRAPLRPLVSTLPCADAKQNLKKVGTAQAAAAGGAAAAQKTTKTASKKKSSDVEAKARISAKLLTCAVAKLVSKRDFSCLQIHSIVGAEIKKYKGKEWLSFLVRARLIF